MSSLNLYINCMFFIYLLSNIVEVSLWWKKLNYKLSVCSTFVLETHFVHLIYLSK